MLIFRLNNNILADAHVVIFKEDGYVAEVADSEKEVCGPVETSFECVCGYDGNKVFRKRKMLRSSPK